MDKLYHSEMSSAPLIDNDWLNIDRMDTEGEQMYSRILVVLYPLPLQIIRVFI